MAWIINEDHIRDEDDLNSRVGHGQWGIEGGVDGQPSMGAFPSIFRIEDEDGTLLYSGRYDAEVMHERWGSLERAFRWAQGDYSASVVLKVRASDWNLLSPSEAATPGDDGWYAPFE